MSVSGRFRLRSLHTGVVGAAEWAVNVADFYGVPVTVTSGKRSWADQLKLRRKHERCVAEGKFRKTADCLWPANVPGHSAHNYGLAWDSVVGDGKDDRLNAWWAAVRTHAGFFVPGNDAIHAEVPEWRQFVTGL